MKHLIIFSFIGLTLFAQSCSKDDSGIEISEDSITQDPSNTSILTKIFEGTFTGQNGYPASGDVILGRNKEEIHYISLQDNFATSFATGSVTMYLSKESKLKLSDGNTYIKLGVINKNGKHDFKLDKAPDGMFKYVIVWCAPAAIQFGNSELK